MRRKVNKGAKRRILVWIFLLFLIVSYMSYNTFTYWKDILKNKKETKELEKKYNKLVDEKEILETDVLKLQDPDYVAKFAREKYLYTKDGELIIKIVEDE